MMPQQNITRPQMQDVFGFQVPIENYYLHRGHAWAVLEGDNRIRVGLDDFSQKLLGPADEVRLPEIGKVYYQDHLCMALFRQGKKASFEAPVDGAIEVINPRVQQQPSLIHDDPYGEGWLFIVKPLNLQRSLENLILGEATAAWIGEETNRLMALMDTTVGATLPDGGEVIDDVFGHYPGIGWRPLVQEFFLRHLTTRGLIPQTEWKKGA
jgi:glycine cleavage system H lipoate-binding protein